MLQALVTHVTLGLRIGVGAPGKAALQGSPSALVSRAVRKFRELQNPFGSLEVLPRARSSKKVPTETPNGLAHRLYGAAVTQLLGT